MPLESTDRQTTLDTLQSLVDSLCRYGERPALIALQKKDILRISFQELSSVAAQLANGLAQRGLRAGDRVAMLAPNQPEWVAGALGTWKAGGVVVPVDVQLSQGVLSHVLEDSAPSFLFTVTDHVERIERLDLPHRPQLILLDGPEDDPRHWERLVSDRPADFPHVEPGDAAILLYTSGTTGPPKGVPLSHRNLTYQLNMLAESGLVGPGDRLLQPLPMHHVYPLVIGMLTPLALGLGMVIPHSLTGPQMVRALSEGQATWVVGVPRLYNALYAGIEKKAHAGGRIAGSIFDALLNLSIMLLRRFDLRVGKKLLGKLHRRFGPQLRVLASGGAAIDPDLAWKLEGLGWQVAIGYGLTETSPLLTINRPGEGRIGSAGRPVPGTELRIAPFERLEDAGVPGDGGQARVGEVQARGPGVFAGYRNLPEATKEVFTDDGWFRTGDLGYFDQDGFLFLTGRASTLIVTPSGKNVQPDEVEDAYQKSPVIGEIGVLQEDGKLVALVLPDFDVLGKQGVKDVEQAVRDAVAAMAQTVPSYQRITDYALTQEPLPRTRLGKLQRHLLRERYRQARAGETKERPPERPMTLEEMPGEDRTLLQDATARQVWQMLAERYHDRRLTPSTNIMLELGIDSMEWLNLSLEIGQRTGVELSDEAIGRIEKVRDLLREVADAPETVSIPSLEFAMERPEEFLSEQQKQWIEPHGPLASASMYLLWAINWICTRPFKVEVRGIENLPADRNYMLTPNHVSYLDPFILCDALGLKRLRNTYWAGWTGVAFANRFASFLSKLSHVVPIELRASAISSLAFGSVVLRRGHNMVWYPEGGRSLDGEVQPFRPGVGIVLQYNPVPVVPVLMLGVYEALPPGRSTPRFVKCTVIFGKPLDPRDLAREGEGREIAEKIANALRERIAQMKRELER